MAQQCVVTGCLGSWRPFSGPCEGFSFPTMYLCEARFPSYNLTQNRALQWSECKWESSCLLLSPTAKNLHNYKAMPLLVIFLAEGGGGHTHSMWKFQGQGSNPHPNHDTRSLTCCATELLSFFFFVVENIIIFHKHIIYFAFFFFFLGPHLQHTEVPS